MRKHRYLPHGSHFGARNGRSGLPGCCWSALKGCSGPALAPPERSKWPLWPALVPPVRSKRLLKRASMLPVRSKLPFWPALVPPVRSKNLLEPASVPLSALKEAVRACCSRSLFESAGLGYLCSEPLSHCTLLCFASCMDMHGYTLVCIYIHT